MRITEFGIAEREVKLRAPFVTALRTVTSYQVVEVQVALDSGNVGIGDCVATPAISGDSHEAILADLNSKNLKALIDCEYPTPTALHEAIALSGLLPSARAALDIALLDAISPLQSVRVATDVTIPICDDGEFGAILAERRAAGFRSFKVKVNRESASTLLERIAQISQSGEYVIRIDPNQSWDFDLACSVMREIESSGFTIDYLEQPLPRHDLAGHAALSKAVATPLMADESIFNLAELELVAHQQVFTWLNVKLLKSGGYIPARALAQRARELGMKVSVGSMMEGERGIRAAAQLAHEIAPELSHDLDAGWWIMDTPLTYSESILSI